MKPITQTQFGKPAGNCFMACVASILEIGLEECPDLTEAHTAGGGEWWQVTQDFLWQRSYQGIYFPAVPFRGMAPSGWSIMSGTAARGLQHCCVAWSGGVAHDPHPDHSGLLDVRSYITLMDLSMRGDADLPLAEDDEDVVHDDDLTRHILEAEASIGLLRRSCSLDGRHELESAEDLMERAPVILSGVRQRQEKS